MDLLRVLRVLDSASCQTRWPVSPPHQLPRMSSRLLLEIHWMPPPTNMDQLLSFELSLLPFYSRLSSLFLLAPFLSRFSQALSHGDWLLLAAAQIHLLQNPPNPTSYYSSGYLQCCGRLFGRLPSFLRDALSLSFLFLFSFLFSSFRSFYIYILFSGFPPPPFLAPLEIVS